MMDHIRQRDWNNTKNVYDQFVDEQSIENCVVEKIIRNKFWDPMISSDDEEPPPPIDWDSIFAKRTSRETQFRHIVPGCRRAPPHPKLSALTQAEHRQCIKVLSAQNKHILPHEFVGKPSKADWTVFEEKKEIYAKEQEEYREWARHLWTTTNCIRALRPKPLVEEVYEAEYRMKTHMIQCFPKSYVLAAQIPLKAENHSCEIVFPKADLIKVDISKLPEVTFPNIYESQECILRECPLPEPCAQHPCKFQLPNETEASLLPLTEIHSELAQFALEHGADMVASESALRCLLEADRAWSLPLSVCEVIGPDGDKSNIVVLGSEYPEKRDPAPARSYRAFRHLLLHSFTQSSKTKPRIEQSDNSQMSLRSQQSAKTRPVEKRSFLARGRKAPPESHRVAAAYNNAVRKLAGHDSDSDDGGRLEIVMDDDSQNTLESHNENNNNMAIDINDTNVHNTIDNQPRKILKARRRSSLDRNTETENLDVNIDTELNKSDNQKSINKTDEESNRTDVQESIKRSITNERQETTTSMNSKTSSQTDSQSSIMGDESGQNDAESSKMDNQSKETDIDGTSQLNAQEEQFDITLHDCVCKDTEFEMVSPRSYKNVLIKNNTTKEKLNIIVHSSHKVKNGMSFEVLLEPILEYQLELGGTLQSPHKVQSLAFALMLRRKAELVNVRVDGCSGEVVTIDKTSLRELTARRGDFKPAIANTLGTALGQLAGLLPAAYLLKHEPSHGANALLFSRACGGSGGVPLLAPASAPTPAEEARLAHAAPPLQPVLLPVHKFYRQLPLCFTYKVNYVAKENKATTKKKYPPAAIQWPKKRGRKRGKK